MARSYAGGVRGCLSRFLDLLRHVSWCDCRHPGRRAAAAVSTVAAWCRWRSDRWDGVTTSKRRGDASARPATPARVRRIDRGWSTLLLDCSDGPRRCRSVVRNIGADVAVGDWVVASADGERVEHVLDAARRSCAGHRSRAPAPSPHTVAANIDVVFLCHSFAVAAEPAPPRARAGPGVRQRRRPDRAAHQGRPRRRPRAGAAGAAGGRPRRAGARHQRSRGERARRAARLRRRRPHGRLPRRQRRRQVDARQRPARRATCRRPPTVRGDQRGRHTTVAAELLPVPDGGLADRHARGCGRCRCGCPGEGIERAFADVFELMDQCRFRDCKHDQEPGCAVRAAIDDGRLDPDRFAQPRAPRRRGGGAGGRAAGQREGSPIAAAAHRRSASRVDP